MANYDTPGVTFDSGLTYDDAVVLQPNKPMAKIKLNLDSLNPDQVVSLGLQVKTAMTGNANFTTPNPSMAALGTLITTAQTKIAAYNSAAAALQTLLTDRDTAVDNLRSGIRQESSYVDNIANGNASIIQSAGMAVRSGRTPASIPGQVQALSITAGDGAGELDLQWDPLSGAKTFEIELSPDALFASGIIKLKNTTKSKAVAENLTSGTRLWARVRATNAAGTGAWSDPATKIVP